MTNLPIDEQLLDEALMLGTHASREALIEAVLREYIDRHRRLQIVKLFGTVEYDQTFDYKAARQRDGH